MRQSLFNFGSVGNLNPPRTEQPGTTQHPGILQILAAPRCCQARNAESAMTTRETKVAAAMRLRTLKGVSDKNRNTRTLPHGASYCFGVALLLPLDCLCRSPVSPPMAETPNYFCPSLNVFTRCAEVATWFGIPIIFFSCFFQTIRVLYM
jgi:hypothetical protein